MKNFLRSLGLAIALIMMLAAQVAATLTAARLWSERNRPRPTAPLALQSPAGDLDSKDIWARGGAQPEIRPS